MGGGTHTPGQWNSADQGALTDHAKAERAARSGGSLVPAPPFPTARPVELNSIRVAGYRTESE